jgi:hypothetical protein
MPAWVTDKAAWERAKKIVSDQYGGVEGNYAIVTHIYQNIVANPKKSLSDSEIAKVAAKAGLQPSLYASLRVDGDLSPAPQDEHLLFVPVAKSFHHVRVIPASRERETNPFMGTIELPGITVDVENLQGSMRSGIDENGYPWSTRMNYHYGEVRDTEGVDGDALDAYVGPNAASSLVVVIHQQNPRTKEYDEDKCMLGFNTVADAISAYKSQYNQPGFYSGHTTLNTNSFWHWVKDPTKRGQRIYKGPPELYITHDVSGLIEVRTRGKSCG